MSSDGEYESDCKIDGCIGSLGGNCHDCGKPITRADPALAAAQAEVARYREVLQRIADAPAWGAPERWEVTPAEVRLLARAALEPRP